MASLGLLGCGSEPQAEPTGDCRLTDSCDPEAWTLKIRGIPRMGGRHYPGLRPPQQNLDGRLLPTAVGGTQTIELDARYVVERPERPEFDLVFEGGAEMVSRTATSVTFRAFHRGQAKMFVEQDGIRGSAAFSFSIPIEEATDADLLPMFSPQQPTLAARISPNVSSLINIQLYSDNRILLVDESLTVTSTAPSVTVQKTGTWDLFTLSALPSGDHHIVVQTAPRSFNVPFGVPEKTQETNIVLYELDREGVEADLRALQRTDVLCATLIGGEFTPFSAAEARFATDDPKLLIESLTGEPGTALESVEAPWCRRLTRSERGESTIVVGIGDQERPSALFFE